MLAVPASFEPVAAAAPQFRALWSAVRDVAEAAREALGEERLAWLSALPLEQRQEHVTLLHASPASLWRAPATDASEDELVRTFGELASPWVVYGHLHRGGIRPLPGLTLVNTGSVSLSHDGDPRAAYALISGGQAIYPESGIRCGTRDPAHQ